VGAELRKLNANQANALRISGNKRNKKTQLSGKLQEYDTITGVMADPGQLASILEISPKTSLSCAQLFKTIWCTSFGQNELGVR
jgi:hypothetical protein